MKVSIRVILRLFFVNATLFGVLVSLCDYMFDNEINVLKQIVQSVLFGLFMSWFAIRTKKRILIESGIKEFKEEDFKTGFSARVSTSISIENAFEILKKYDKNNNWNLSITNNRIEGGTKISSTSWGEKLIINFYKEKIEIKSVPRFKLLMMDNGESRINVNTIKTLLANE